jgi:molecular chaperone GrpE
MNRRSHKHRPEAVETPPSETSPEPAPPSEQADQVAASAESPCAELAAKLDECARELDQERNARLRALADMQNFRRRAEEQKRDAAQFAISDFAEGLLSVLDNFDRALASAEKAQSFEALMGGVALTQKQLTDVLKRNGLEPIEAAGLPFDPNLHEAILTADADDLPENTVIEDLQRGYTLHGRVLRASKVKVSVQP